MRLRVNGLTGGGAIRLCIEELLDFSLRAFVFDGDGAVDCEFSIFFLIDSNLLDVNTDAYALKRFNYKKGSLKKVRENFGNVLYTLGKL